ncbi:hypothetical protein Hanom_Chr07g00660371 [Helianthus anomalus]
MSLPPFVALPSGDAVLFLVTRGLTDTPLVAAPTLLLFLPSFGDFGRVYLLQVDFRRGFFVKFWHRCSFKHQSLSQLFYLRFLVFLRN